MCRRTARKLPWIRSDEETPAEVKPPTNNRHDKMTYLCHFVCISLVGIVVAKKECEGRRVDVHWKADKREQIKQHV
jgi:hypothetical protein